MKTDLFNPVIELKFWIRFTLLVNEIVILLICCSLTEIVIYFILLFEIYCDVFHFLMIVVIFFSIK